MNPLVSIDNICLGWRAEIGEALVYLNFIEKYFELNTSLTLQNACTMLSAKSNAIRYILVQLKGTSKNCKTA